MVRDAFLATFGKCRQIPIQELSAIVGKGQGRTLEPQHCSFVGPGRGVRFLGPWEPFLHTADSTNSNSRPISPGWGPIEAPALSLNAPSPSPPPLCIGPA